MHMTLKDHKVIFSVSKVLICFKVIYSSYCEINEKLDFHNNSTTYTKVCNSWSCRKLYSPSATSNPFLNPTLCSKGIHTYKDNESCNFSFQLDLHENCATWVKIDDDSSCRKFNFLPVMIYSFSGPISHSQNNREKLDTYINESFSSLSSNNSRTVQLLRKFNFLFNAIYRFCDPHNCTGDIWQKWIIFAKSNSFFCR